MRPDLHLAAGRVLCRDQGLAFGGFILAFPYIGMQMWRFVAPGLYKSEKNAFLPFMLASPFMFLLGASFAFYVVTPWLMTFPWVPAIRR